MTSILEKAGINYLFLDQDGSVCCGRPMMLAGKKAQAEAMIRHNKNLILATKAKTLVTSCPICHRIFKEEYNLPIRIVHHSQYLLELVKQGRLPFSPIITVLYTMTHVNLAVMPGFITNLAN